MPAVKPARNREGGAIAILMTMCLMMLIGFAALGYDLAYVRLARLEMKSASDAAAHAGVLILRSSSGDTAKATNAALAVSQLNTVVGKTMHLQTNDVVFGSWDSLSKTFTQGSPITAVKIAGIRETSDTNDGYVNLTFGKALGFSETSVTEDTIGAFSDRYFMVEMDITPSYICDIDNAVVADLALLDDLYARKIGGDQISLDVFTGMSTELTPFMNIRTRHDDIYRAWTGGTLTYAPFLVSGVYSGRTAGITVCNKLDDTSTTVVSKKGGTINCGTPGAAYPNNINAPACSQVGPTGYATPLFAGTDLGAAIRAGTAKLVAQSKDYEPRVLIIVTDGTPMTCTAPQGGDLCYKGVSPCCADGFCDQSAAHASGVQERMDACDGAHAILTGANDAADAAAKASVDLFIIKITGSATDTSSNYAATLKRRRGTFTWIADASQLANTFRDIVGQVPISLVQ
jgi:Flp pilus assembly protein TadG